MTPVENEQKERELSYCEGRRRPSLPCHLCGDEPEFSFPLFMFEVGVWDVFISAGPDGAAINNSSYACDPCLRRIRDAIVELLNGAQRNGVVLSARVLEGNRDPNARGYTPGDIIR